MKRILVCCLSCLLLLLTACGKQTPSVVAGEESETITMASPAAVTAARTLDEEEIVCTPKKRDGKVYGFEMRFPRTTEETALFSSAENLYYGVVTVDGKAITVPMELVRVLEDQETIEFVITLLLPDGQTVSGKTCTAAFYVAKREGNPADALFCAKKDVQIA